eukprot:3434180-Amphidinium_carterae.1
MKPVTFHMTEYKHIFDRPVIKKGGMLLCLHRLHIHFNLHFVHRSEKQRHPTSATLAQDANHCSASRPVE